MVITIAESTIDVMLEDPAYEHSTPSIRMCKIDRNESGCCGFHLTKTKWDPYPWIAGIDPASAAHQAGLKVGDCVLEVNGEDVLGLRVTEIAEKAQSGNEFISILLWNAGSDSNCDSQSLCCTPMPTSLSRLSSCLSSILSFLECPVCFDIISPPAHQCPCGHLICFRCRVCIERCPICRSVFTRERSLLADQIYNSIIEAFHLKEQSTTQRTTKLWKRIFGRNEKRERNSHSDASRSKLIPASELKNKFLTRLIGKSSSVDDLANSATGRPNFTQALRKKSISTTDVHTESLKRLNYLQSKLFPDHSSESLPKQESGSGTLSRYSSTNSCDGLGGGRRNFANSTYYTRQRNHNHKERAGDNLFQFSSETTEADTVNTQLYHCPLSEQCPPLSTFALLTHLQQHDSPVVQYFKSKFTIRLPFSLDDGTIIIVHCYESSFFLKIQTDERFGDVKLGAWLLGTESEAKEYKLKVNWRGSDNRTDLKFKAAIHSIHLCQPIDQIYKYQIVITNSTSQIYFHDKSYSIDIYFKSVRM